MRAVQWLHWNTRAWSSSGVIVMLKWRYHIMSQFSVFRNFWESFLNMKMRYLGVSKKKKHGSCEGGIAKSVPRNNVWHHEASLVMPNGNPQDVFFYSTLTLKRHDRFLYSSSVRLMKSYGLWMKSYGLWMKGYGLWMKSYGLWMKSYGLWIKRYWLWMKCYGLWMKSYRLCVFGSCFVLQFLCHS